MPVYISIREAMRLAECSRSMVKRWLVKSRHLIDAGQNPLFDFIDPKNGRHGRVYIHRELFLAFRAGEHRTRQAPPVSARPKQERRCGIDLLTPSHRPQHQTLPRDKPSWVTLTACLPADAPPSRTIEHDHVLLYFSGHGSEVAEFSAGRFRRC